MGVRITGITLLLLAVSVAAEGPSEQDFAKDLQKAQKYVRAGRWKLALKTYGALFEEHADRDYVRLRRTEIIEEYGRCLFRTQNPDPDLSTLISGRVVSFSRRTGKIKLAYKRRALADFKRSGTLLVHPMIFTGPYSVELRGRRYPDGGLSVYVDVQSDTGYAVSWGHALHGSSAALPNIQAIVRNKWRVVAKKQESPLVVGKSYALRVHVGAKTIQARSKKRVVVQAKKLSKGYGAVALSDAKFDSLTLAGTINPGWVQGLIDGHLAPKRKAFEASYKPRKTLPVWLFHPMKSAPADTGATDDEWPDEVEGEHLLALTKATLLVTQEEYREALDYIGGLGDGALPPLTRGFLIAQCRFELGDFEQGLQACESVCKQNPRFVHARLLRANLLLRLRRRQEGVDEYLLIAKEFSGIEAQMDAAVHLLRAGRQEDALRIVRTANARLGPNKELDALERMLSMAKHGPQWGRTFEYKSKNYVVRSDIDKAICMEAAKTLEQAYTAYQAQLGWVKGRKSGERFRVYLFSAEPGYQRYCGRIVGRAMAHTAGLYSPSLKQLLIWNLPDRDRMFRTIRHEGFHQYLDRVVPGDPPVWLNEGLAEYYETAQRTARGTRGGQMRRDHLAQLQKPVPLEEFIYITHEQFYKNPRLHYAQAWALVHFLQHSEERRHKRMFEKLIEQLHEGRSGKSAVDAAFPNVKFLRVLFESYVMKQRGVLR